MKISRPLVYTLLGIIVVAAFVVTSPEDAEAPGKKAPATAARKSETRGGFLPEDYEARFEPVSGPAKNAFRPIAVRSGAAGLTSRVDSIPAPYAGNEMDWIYTGTAEIDGVPVALFENTANRDGVFLKQGERFKTSVVLQIGPSFVVLSGSGGGTYRVSLPPYGSGPEEGPLEINEAAMAALSRSPVTITPENSGSSTNLRESNGD